MDKQLLMAFKNRIAGEVVLPEDSNYNELRNVYSQHGSPTVIVRAKNAADITDAIQFSLDNNLKLAIRSGGHSPSGLSTNDGGLVIDLSHFDTVEVLDEARPIVRVGAGAKWGNVAQSLAAHNLAISSGDTNSVGVGGLTLGGGIGWLVRKHGLTIDSLLAAELITADGRTLRVSETEHPDLFWALRGGGGNFGIVTAFEFRAQSVTSIFGGMIVYDIREMETVLNKWSAYMRTAPEELNSTLVIIPGFGPQPVPQMMAFVCYGGDDESAANAAFKPLLELGTIHHQEITRKPYYKMLEDAAPPPGVKAASGTGFIKRLDPDVLAVIAANVGRPGTPIIQIRSLGGIMSRIDPDATAFAHRGYEAFLLMAALVPFEMPSEQADRVRQEAWTPFAPFASGGYINFMSDTSESSIASAYPPATYARLASVKEMYDPNNVFNQNHNIKPLVAAR
ncbi:MAG: FAD-binding oxidoreductase [Anaerolineae bacterium]|nr:FAD-binding oxidoreductase [Anaerolineae bacterium]